MEFHTPASVALSKKLSNGHSFTGKSVYDGVFSGHLSTESRFGDYGEVFGRSGSTIPLLDVPELSERKLAVDVGSSKLDYSKIFGGFGGSDFAISHEELVAIRKDENSSTEEAARTPAESRSNGSYASRVSAEDQVLTEKAPYQSFDSVKQFKMLYHKTERGIKNGTNGTTHIAEIDAVDGYTCLIDDFAPMQKSESDKPVLSVLNDVCSNINFRGVKTEGKYHEKTEPDLPPGGVSKPSIIGGEVKGEFTRNRSTWNAGPTAHFAQLPPPSSLPHTSSHKGDSDGSVSSKLGVSEGHPSEGASGFCSPPLFDEDLDTDSVAAASAAAVKKAIEEAQERIKMARQLMERKKGGLLNRAKPSFSDDLEASGRRGRKNAHKGNKFREEAVQKINEEADTPVQAFAETTKQNAGTASQMASEFRGKEKLFIAEEANREEIKTTLAEPRQEDIKEWETMRQGDRSKKMRRHWDVKNVPNGTFENPEEYHKKIKEAIAAYSQENVERNLKAAKEASDTKECSDKLNLGQKSIVQKENEKHFRLFQQHKETGEKLEASKELDAREMKLAEIQKLKENMRKLEISIFKDNENSKHLEEAHECSINWKEQKEAHIQEENEARLGDPPDTEEESMPRAFSGQDENKKTNEKACEVEAFDETLKNAYVPEENDCDAEHVLCGEDIEKGSDQVQEPKKIEVRPRECHDRAESEKSVDENDESERNENLIEEEEDFVISTEPYQMGEAEERQKETCKWEETESIKTELDQGAEDEKKIVAQESFQCHWDNVETNIGACMQEELENQSSTSEECRHEENNEDVEVTSVAHPCGEHDSESSFEFEEHDVETKAVELEKPLDQKMICETANLRESTFEPDEIMNAAKDTVKVMTLGVTYVKEPELFSNARQRAEELTCELEENYEDVQEAEVLTQDEEDENNTGSSLDESCASNENEVAPNKFEGKGETTGIADKVKMSNGEEKEKNQCKTQTLEDREAGDTLEKDEELVKDRMRKINEAKEREREREKERIAVERAIREARERAFAEAREKAERAAVERQNVKARQRSKGDARETVEKTSAKVTNKSSDEKASLEARLKAERAAVERATAEARERALQKALSENATTEARKHSEKFSYASKDNGLRQKNSSHGAEYKGAGPSSSSRHPNSSSHAVPSTTERSDGPKSEPVERCKATLERHQRTAERAAKALAEKNRRDLLAQKEQAERNRLAEVLDAEVKRWSSGKEGNLRALLSTLQYILGPDSGWQPVPLTDIVTAAAVKKAYRKATLFVHPDKLQQRGASIQQKYTCEKVFDLLKDAWNKFSREER